MKTSTPTPQVGVKIYNGNRGVITFYGDTIKKCNFHLSPYLKIFGKGNKLYLNQLEGAPKGARQYPFQKNGTIQFGGKNLCDSMRRYEGKFFLLHDDGQHSYYIDTEESKVADKPNKIQKGEKDMLTFVNPVQTAKDGIREIAKEKELTFAEKVNALYGDQKPMPTKPEVVPDEPVVKKAKPLNAAESFVINTLRELSDECIDSDDLAGAKALLKAIRKFTENFS